MDQRNETFVPRLLAVTTGTVVDFPNSDRTYHNVFSLSRARRFDLGRYASGRSKSVRFDRPGVVRVFCDIHSHMSAFVVVFNHPFFRVTDVDGRYRLDDVPAGTYTVVGWYEGEARVQRSVTVAAGAARPSSTWRCRDPRPRLAAHAASSSPARCSPRRRSARPSTSSACGSPPRPKPSCSATWSRPAGLVDQQSASLFDSFTRTATLIADLPKFKAALETRDGPTIEPIARDYLMQAGADLVVVAGPSRRAPGGGDRAVAAGQPAGAAGASPTSATAGRRPPSGRTRAACCRW